MNLHEGVFSKADRLVRIFISRGEHGKTSKYHKQHICKYIVRNKHVYIYKLKLSIISSAIENRFYENVWAQKQLICCRMNYYNWWGLVSVRSVYVCFFSITHRLFLRSGQLLRGEENDERKRFCLWVFSFVQSLRTAKYWCHPSKMLTRKIKGCRAVVVPCWWSPGKEIVRLFEKLRIMYVWMYVCVDGWMDGWEDYLFLSVWSLWPIVAYSAVVYPSFIVSRLFSTSSYFAPPAFWFGRHAERIYGTFTVLYR